MICKAADSAQTKAEYCQAVLNRRMHSNSICPANHSVSYQRGWFYVDDNPPFQDPALTAEAEEAMADPSKCVGYWSEGNCYILIDND